MNDGGRVNPMIPSSVGALLAEEWMINPTSPLPSFLEMIMIQEAHKSGYTAILSSLQFAETWMIQYALDHWNHASVIRRFKSRVFKWIAERVLRRKHSEITVTVNYLLHLTALQSKASATLSEALYGGKRVKLGIPSDGDTAAPIRQPSKSDMQRLALFLSLGPYISQKLEDWHSRGLDRPNRLNKMEKLLYFVYPYLQMSTHTIASIFRLRYLLGKSLYFDPLSAALKLVVRRVTADDNQTKPSSSNQSQQAQTISKLSWQNLPTKTRRLVVGGVSSVIALSWFARLYAERQHQRRLQRQQRYQNNLRNDERANMFGQTNSNSALLPPPPAEPRIKSIVLQSRSPKLCPLCRQLRVQPAASTGGYVFCLRCLLNFIREHGACPITKMQCPESKIVRLYEPRN